MADGVVDGVAGFAHEERQTGTIVRGLALASPLPLCSNAGPLRATPITRLVFHLRISSRTPQVGRLVYTPLL